MAKKSFKSKAINAVISAIVRTLFAWAKEWSDDAFFFLVVGDKTCTHVAWQNTEDLSCDGALAISEKVEIAGAFQDLAGSVDLLIDDQLKDETFRKEYEQTAPSKDKSGWHSFSFDDEEGGEQ